MPRGKAAAQAANRRLAEAKERIAALELKLQEDQKRHQEESQDLKQERDQARNRLVRDVGAASRETIQQAQQEAAQHVRDIRDAHDLRIRNALGFLAYYISEEALDFEELEKWETFSKAIALPMPKILLYLGASSDPNGGTRSARRAGVGHGRGCRCGCARQGQMVTRFNPDAEAREAGPAPEPAMMDPAKLGKSGTALARLAAQPAQYGMAEPAEDNDGAR